MLQLWHVDVGVVDALLPTDLGLLVRAWFIISDGYFSHKRVTVACSYGSTRRLIDRLARYALPCSLGSRSVGTAPLSSTFRGRRLSYLHKVFFLKLVSLILVAGFVSRSLSSCIILLLIR